MLPCADHFEDLIGYFTGRAVGRDANKARNAAHPLALVRRIAARAKAERLGGFPIVEPGDVFEAKRLAGGYRDRLGQRPRHFVPYPGLEHRLRSRLDPTQQLGARNLETKAGGRVARVGAPEPVGGRLQRPSGIGELEGPHDPTAVVRMHRGGRSGIALGQQLVGALTAKAVIEALPVLAPSGDGAGGSSSAESAARR